MLIYDVGMNNGDDTAFYLRHGFRVLGIEPNPALVATIRKRFSREIESGHLKILNVAVAEEETEMPFWVCLTDDRLSTLNSADAARSDAVREIRVPCRKFRSILDEHGVPFFMKIDIQGNDRQCIEALHRGELPRFVSIEFLISDMCLLKLMRERGFTRFKLISQRDFLPLELPFVREARKIQFIERLNQSRRLPLRAFRRLGGQRWINRRFARCRRSSDGWIFPLGSSGPFGNDLPGRWLDWEEICTTTQAFLRLRAQDSRSLLWAPPGIPPNPFWLDLHARSD